MYLLGPLFDLVDVVCLRGRWTLKITRLGLVGRVVCQQSRGWCASSVRWCFCSGYLNISVGLGFLFLYAVPNRDWQVAQFSKTIDGSSSDWG